MSPRTYTLRRFCTSFSHITPQGNAAMVDVTPKPATVRTATASAHVTLGKVYSHLCESSAETAKGNVFTTAQLAGIQAAKQTSHLIPLCHPLSLSHVSIQCNLNPSSKGLDILANVKTNASTGVEMEALTAASVAALTVYDMCKAISKDMKIQVQLVEKRGGKSDDFSRH